MVSILKQQRKVANGLDRRIFLACLMTIKGQFISVCVTHEGEQVRTIPGVPAVAPPASTPILWAICDSCHAVGFTLDATFTGNVYPKLDLEGSLTQLTEPISINSADSFTGDGVLDASGNLYCLNFYKDDAPGTTVTYYPALSTKNTAPTRVLGGTLTTLPNAASVTSNNITKGGVCLGATSKIYVGVLGKLYQFASAASGNVAPLANVDVSGIGNVKSCRFDPINGYVWLGFDNNSIAAYDETLTQQRLITGAATGLNKPEAVWLDSAGLVYVANNGAKSIAVYAANANGNAAPTKTISGAATLLNSPLAGVTGSDGTIYVGDQGAGPGTGDLLGATYTSAILVFSSSASGNAAPTKSITGANVHIDHMLDGTGSQPCGLLIAPTASLTAPYHPPATLFTSAKLTAPSLTLPATGRYGLLMSWTFCTMTAQYVVLEDTGLAGIALNLDNAGNRVLQLFDATGAQILIAKEGTIRRQCWFQDLISWDTTTQTLQWYLGGTSSSNLFGVTWSSSNLVGYPGSDGWQVGSSSIATPQGMSDLWFDVPNSFYDLAVAANLAKFAAAPDTMTSTPYCFPVSMGTNGTGPLGSTPHIFFSGAGNAYATNQGTAGGTWTIAGTLADAQNTP